MTLLLTTLCFHDDCMACLPPHHHQSFSHAPKRSRCPGPSCPLRRWASNCGPITSSHPTQGLTCHPTREWQPRQGAWGLDGSRRPTRCCVQQQQQSWSDQGTAALVAEVAALCNPCMQGQRSQGCLLCRGTCVQAVKSCVIPPCTILYDHFEHEVGSNPAWNCTGLLDACINALVCQVPSETEST